MNETNSLELRTAEEVSPTKGERIPQDAWIDYKREKCRMTQLVFKVNSVYGSWVDGITQYGSTVYIGIAMGGPAL